MSSAIDALDLAFLRKAVEIGQLERAIESHKQTIAEFEARLPALNAELQEIQDAIMTLKIGCK